MNGATASHATGPCDEKDAIASVLSVAPIVMAPLRPPSASAGLCHGPGQSPGVRRLFGGDEEPSLPAAMKNETPAVATFETA